MTGKDAGASVPRWQSWQARLSFLAAAAAVLAACFAARQFWGPGAASAQAPPAARSANPRTQVTARPRTAPADATAGAAQAVSELKVMAVVNGQQIARAHLADECLRRYGSEVLESIVNKHLIWQECQRLGIVISEQDVNDEVARMAGKFGLPVDRWLTMLEKERDITPDKYRRDIIWPTLALRSLAANQIEVTPQELREAFESEYGPKVKVRMISVSSAEKAEQVWQQARANPESFGDLAKEYSEDPNSAAARGLIPPVRKHAGEEQFEKAAFALQPGEISPIIHVAQQYLILKCEAHLPESYVSSQHIQQIESQLHDQIRDQKLRTAAADLFRQLQERGEVVNVYGNPALEQQMPGVAATINGRQIPLQQLAEESLLRHGKEVLEGEINRVVLIQELKRRGKTVSEPAIDEEIARAADSYGYVRPDGQPDIDGWLQSVTEIDNVTIDLYVRDAVWPSVALKLLVQDQVQVDQDDLNKGFAANYGERAEVLAIVLSNQRLANKVWDMARNNPTDKFFGELANQYSIEPVSKANFGKIPPIRQHSGQPVIEDEAFRLQPGELSAVIAVGDKYIILRCLGRTEPVVQDFNAVKDELRKDIHEKKLRVAMATEFDRLKETAQIDNFLAGSSQTGQPRSARAPSGPAAR